MIRILFALLLLFTSCKSALIAPEPKNSLSNVTPLEQNPSQIILPVTIDLGKYIKQADNQVPKVFDGDQQTCEGVSVNYHFERDPLQVSGKNNEVTLGVNGKYRIKLSYCPKCSDVFSSKPSCLTPRIPFSCGVGEPMRRMNLVFKSEYQLTKQYGVKTKTVLEELKAIDPCEVTVFKYDATKHLLTEVEKQLNKIATDIDKMTQKVSFKKEADDFWKMGFEPQKIEGFGYLTLNPSKLMIKTPNLKGSVLETKLVMIAYPEFDTKKKSVIYKELPELAITDKLTDDSIRIVSDLTLGYDSISAIAQKFLGGKKLDLKGNAVVFDSIRFIGSNGNKVIIRLNFSGSKQGVIYLEGKPLFNDTLQEVKLSEVAFDLETKSILLKSAKWLFNDRILKEIENASVFNLTAQLEKSRKDVNKSLKFKVDDFLLQGSVTKIKVIHIFSELESLKVRLFLNGMMSLKDDSSSKTKK